MSHAQGEPGPAGPQGPPGADGVKASLQTNCDLIPPKGPPQLTAFVKSFSWLYLVAVCIP